MPGTFGSDELRANIATMVRRSQMTPHERAVDELMELALAKGQAVGPFTVPDDAEDAAP